MSITDTFQQWRDAGHPTQWAEANTVPFRRVGRGLLHYRDGRCLRSENPDAVQVPAGELRDELICARCRKRLPLSCYVAHTHLIGGSAWRSVVAVIEAVDQIRSCHTGGLQRDLRDAHRCIDGLRQHLTAEGSRPGYDELRSWLDDIDAELRRRAASWADAPVSDPDGVGFFEMLDVYGRGNLDSYTSLMVEAFAGTALAGTFMFNDWLGSLIGKHLHDDLEAATRAALREHLTRDVPTRGYSSERQCAFHVDWVLRHVPSRLYDDLLDPTLPAPAALAPHLDTILDRVCADTAEKWAQRQRARYRRDAATSPVVVVVRRDQPEPSALERIRYVISRPNRARLRLIDVLQRYAVIVGPHAFVDWVAYRFGERVGRIDLGVDDGSIDSILEGTVPDVNLDDDAAVEWVATAALIAAGTTD